MTQNEIILKHLETYGKITPYQALREYGCLRLGARIWDLRDDGYVIDTKVKKHKNKFGKQVYYAEYILKE